MNARTKRIALTFDDGPHADTTPRLLDILRVYDAKATFFLLGNALEAHPDIAARALREGHCLGNHSYDHDDLADLTEDEISYQLSRTNGAFADKLSFRPTAFRPPYGNCSGHVQDAAAALGMGIVFWTASCNDWCDRDAANIAAQVINSAREDGIALLHDWNPATVDAVETILATLTAAGYTFVTAEEICGGFTPGTVYGNRKEGVL